MNAENEMRYRLLIMDEALSLLTLILESDRRLSLADLTLATGMTKNKMFRLLKTFELQGILDKDKAGRYAFGINAFIVAQNVFNRIEMLDVIHPFLEKLAWQLNEDVYLARKVHGQATFVAKVNSRQKVTIRSYIGSVLREAPREKSEGFMDCLEVIDGVTFSVGAIDPEITTVAVDLPACGKRERGTLVVVAPTFRMPLERIRSHVIPVLHETVGQMGHFQTESASSATVPTTLKEAGVGPFRSEYINLGVRTA